MAEAQTSIARFGTTTIQAGSRAQTATITVRTIPLRKSDAMFPVNWTWSDEIVAVQALTISVNGEMLFVPSSLYVDLIDPSEMSARVDKSAFILEIHGADGSESYFVRINFDKSTVKRRALYSPLNPGTPTEDTRYFVTELKDK